MKSGRNGVLGVAVLTLAVAGCGSSQNAKPVEVSGHVLRGDGQPIKGAKLEFVPFPFSEMKPDDPCPIALTDDKGAFKLSDGKSHSVQPRRYKVTVKGLLPKDKGLTPPEYHDPETTPLDVTISRDGNSDLTIRVN